MAKPISLALRLDERRPDRVFVSVILAPRDPDASVGGVSVQMFSRSGQSLGARLLLPIAGQLSQTMRSSVELRTLDALPPGARVVATAWWSGGQLEATCPTDPGTELGSHMRGESPVTPSDSDILQSLDATERERIAALFPWVNEPMLPPDQPAAYFEPAPEDDTDSYVDELADHYELDDESAEWLKELMSEDD